MFLDTKQKAECFGCTACLQICPVNAIEMEEDEEGFLYPIINEEKCIHCDMCKKVCPYQENKRETETQIYGVKLKDIEQRKKSQSGGAFFAIASYILKNGGIVYGVSVCDELEVKHIRVTTLEQLDKIRGSKYVQSDIQEIYSEIESDLIDGHLVLFSGTACQIQGLQKYITMRKIVDDKLYTCDLICHGVPSPKIYREYIQFFEKKYHTKIKDFNFRDKTYGWKNHFETMTLQNNKKITKPYYRNIFYSNNPLRPSCYSCQFATTQRITDFTVGDFWGIENTNAEFSNPHGVSLLFVQTNKGKEILKKILEKGDLIYFSTQLENCLQHNLQQPTEKPVEREKFWQEYHKRGFKFILKKYGNISIKKKLYMIIYRILSKAKRKIINIKETLRK